MVERAVAEPVEIPANQETLVIEDSEQEQPPDVLARSPSPVPDRFADDESSHNFWSRCFGDAPDVSAEMPAVSDVAEAPAASSDVPAVFDVPLSDAPVETYDSMAAEFGSMAAEANYSMDVSTDDVPIISADDVPLVECLANTLVDSMDIDADNTPLAMRPGPEALLHDLDFAELAEIVLS